MDPNIIGALIGIIFAIVTHKYVIRQAQSVIIYTTKKIKRTKLWKKITMRGRKRREYLLCEDPYEFKIL